MLEFWYVSALSIGCMILLLVVCILLFRMNRYIKDQRQRQVTAQWVPLLADIIHNECCNADGAASWEYPSL